MLKSRYICGASIITTKKLITAAHCTKLANNVNQLQARVGSSKPDNGGKLVPIRLMDEHPQFNKTSYLDNDIAVLHLFDALEFSATIGAIQLARASSSLPAGAMVTASGFGSTSLGGTRPDSLHYVTMPIVHQQKCIEAYSKINFIINDRMFCAAYMGTGKKDPCQGDSGG